jgi:hypothetical protein
MTWITEYKKSLKNLHAEEPLDVYFYRPLAFIIVKTFYAFPLTPNHYSFLALLSGITSGFYFLKGTTEGMQWGAFYFLLFAILDCCDGMVARLKKNGSEFGRLIDGVVDYTVNVIVYTTLAIGLKKQVTTDLLQPWMLVIAAGVSKALHSITYDHYLNEYLSYEKGNSGFVLNEIDDLKKKLEKHKSEGASLLRITALKLYLGYSVLQAGKIEKALVYNPSMYCQKNLLALRLWSFVGPAVHIAFLILAFLFKAPAVLFSYAIIFGNLWLIVMFLFQFKINHELSIQREMT